MHPQSVIHRLVAYRDGSVLAQLGTPDMRMPIAHALGWPERIDGAGAAARFRQPRAARPSSRPTGRFPGAASGARGAGAGGVAPAVLNAANEVAVAAFLDRRIGFLDIARVVENVLVASGDLAATRRLARSRSRRPTARPAGGPTRPLRSHALTN